MKKLLSLTLAAIMLAAALASCAVPPETDAAIGANVRLTSSDGEDAAKWLTERLGDRLTDRVAIGTESDGYGVDLSALENDGYVIRTLGGEVALFARTTVGLDRAARRYAKSVEAGEAVADVTYHEGYRVKRLTIAGNDISEYAIRIEGEKDAFGEYLSAWVRANAATVFSRLIEKACGAGVAIDGEAEHHIVFRQIENGDFKRNSYRYFVENGDLVFEYTDTTGAKYGSLMFLEDQLGWEDLTYGPDHLAESEEIDVAEGLDVTVHPMFESMEMYDVNFDRAGNSVSAINWGYYDHFTTIKCAMHGMATNDWSDTNPGTAQICYSNETIYQTCLNNILDHIEARIDAGAVIGGDLAVIDVAQGDGFSYCQCADCKKVRAQENNAYSGTVVRWTNRLAAEIAEAGYGGIKYAIFAYHGSNVPCVTAPSDDVWITFCTDGHCSRHLLDGSQCQWESFDMIGYLGRGKTFNNNDYIGWIRGWCDLTDNLYVWYYTLEDNFQAWNNLDTLYEDFKLLQECGVRGVFWQASPYELGIHTVQTRIGMSMNCRPEMTKEEFISRELRELEHSFGDGWKEIAEVLDLWSDAEYAAENCWNCWSYDKRGDYFAINHEYYLAHWDQILDLLDAAIEKACSTKQQKAVEVLSVSFLYQGCFSAYFTAYENGDAETMALLEERYELLCERIGNRKNGTIHGDWEKTVYDDLHETAWNYWVTEREYFFPEGTELKPVPEEYVVKG